MRELYIGWSDITIIYDDLHVVGHDVVLREVDAMVKICHVITGPPTYSVGGRLVTVAGVCRRL